MRDQPDGAGPVRRVDIAAAGTLLAALRCDPLPPAAAADERVRPAPTDEPAPVLLLPGYPGSKEDFATLVPLLAAGGRCAVAVDQRGQNESPGLGDPDGYTLDGYGRDAVAVAGTLAGGAPVHLLGHSFGGLVAQAAVVAESAAFASLTLLCTGPGAHPMSDLAWMLPALQAGDVDALWAGQRDRLGPADTARAALVHDRLFAGDPAYLLAGYRLIAAAADRVGQVAATGVPVLVVRGEHDDGWPREQQEEMARRLGGRYEIVADAGHSPALEQPALLAALLLDVLAGVERR